MPEKPTYEELAERIQELGKVESSFRQAESEMEESRSLLEAALESTADGILVVGTDGSWRSFNRKMVEMWGIPEEIWEKGDDKAALDHINDILNDPDEFMATVGDLYRNPEKQSYDTIELKDGRILERYSMPQRLGEEIVGRVWSFRDVTHRIKAEKALKESEERFRELAEMLPEAVFETDWELNLTYANRQAFELFGYTEDDLKRGLFGLDMFVPEDRPRLEESIDRRLKGESTGRTEYRALKKDGTTFPIMFHASSIKEGGKLAGLRGIVIDITEIKRSEDILKREKERAETYLNIAGVIIVALDSRGMVTMINRKGCEILGYSESDIVGKSWFENFLPRKESGAVRDFFETLLEGGIDEAHENLVLTSRGEERLIAWHNTTLYGSEGKVSGLLSSGEDITDTRRAELEKAELEEQYHHSQKVESLGRLAGGVAHDLNNLLTPILGYSEVLLADIEATDKKYKAVNEIMRAGFKARDLVKQLLAFGRKQTLEYQLVDLNKTVYGFEPLLRRTIREDIEIKIIPTYERCTTMADIGQVEQVLMNLAVNAQDAMSEGGTLTIETSVVEVDEKFSAIHLDAEPGEYVLLKVSDTGSGMDEKILDKIFEPFFTTKGEVGTGLGLATVYGIVKQHGGNIQVDSKLGQGTVFDVYLPFSEGSAKARKTGKKISSKLIGSEAVLVVEDDPQVRHFTCFTLKRYGYAVLEAESGPKALDILEKQRCKVDLLLTDVILPGMNGNELHGEIVRKCPNIKVLYMSGYTGDAIARHGVLEENVAFIQKPFAGQALAIKVREVLDQ